MSVDIGTLRKIVSSYESIPLHQNARFEMFISPRFVHAMLDEIVALRAQVAELEAERGMIAYIGIETNPYSDVIKRVMNDALFDVRRKPHGDT